MRLIGYARTRLVEDVGEEDLIEQERSIADFCKSSNHELTHVLADESEQPSDIFEQALSAEVDGIVITDPLVLAEDIDHAVTVADQLVSRGKHLFIVCHNQHIDPDSADAEQTLVDCSLSLINRKVS